MIVNVMQACGVFMYGSEVFFLWGTLGLLGVGVLVGIGYFLRHFWSDKEDRRQPLEAIRSHHEIVGRLQSLGEIWSTHSADMLRTVDERISLLTHRIGQTLSEGHQQNQVHVAQFSERLAVIDAAQSNIVNLSQEIVDLRSILANRQARGLYGQGHMEAIIKDNLPVGSYLFQMSLSNGARPDCLIRLPEESRSLVIDSKFPLENIQAFRLATRDKERQEAAQRVRGDMQKHIKDIAEKYLIIGETQDIALLFVPSESLYADLYEHFYDVLERAQRAQVILVSPSLLTLAIQVVRSLVRDARLRQEAGSVQKEVRVLLGDVQRLRERIDKLEVHVRQASDDMGTIRVSMDKVIKRATRIDSIGLEAISEEMSDRSTPSSPM
jgi:DNA recombination protein RmuC